MKKQIFYGRVENGEIKCNTNFKMLLSYLEGKEIFIEIGLKEKKRTSTQNNAMHLYYSHLATALNDAGLDMRKVLKPEIEIPWTTISIKNFLWRPIQRILFGKESTTELNTKEVSEIYEVINRTIGEKHKIHVPFPSNDFTEFNKI